MAVNNEALTEKSLDGDGVFDRLMATTRLHLDKEFTLGRIKGPDYAQVYLASLAAVLDQSVRFLLERDITDLRAELLELERQKLEFERDKAAAEIPLIQAQTALTQQQLINLQLEAENIPKQGLVLDGQKCKLDAEFDLLVEQKLKVIAERELLNQKKATELAQTNGGGVTSNSVIGKQVELYQAQRDGFHRNAEQQAAKVMVDTWMARRTTDEATAANDINRLSDTNIGQAIATLLAGVNA